MPWIDWAIIIVGWIAGAILNGAIAREKNFEVGEMFARSILFSPLLVYLYLLAVPPRPRK